MIEYRYRLKVFHEYKHAIGKVLEINGLSESTRTELERKRDTINKDIKKIVDSKNGILI